MTTNWDLELEAMESPTDDELGERLEEIDRMAAAAGITTAYLAPFPPEPWWHSILAMLLWPVVGVCAVGIAYAAFGAENREPVTHNYHTVITSPGLEAMAVVHENGSVTIDWEAVERQMHKALGTKPA